MSTLLTPEVEILHLFISPQHVYFGHHGGPSGEEPVREVAEIECAAGKGVRGDRFFDYKPDYKGQITFFAIETHRELCGRLGIRGAGPEVYRRNVVTRGCDLNEWIGREFEIQGVRFAGVEECRPCYWMDEALRPGAEEALKGRGGLRARILSDGTLRRTG